MRTNVRRRFIAAFAAALLVLAAVPAAATSKDSCAAATAGLDRWEELPDAAFVGAVAEYISACTSTSSGPQPLEELVDELGDTVCDQAVVGPALGGPLQLDVAIWPLGISKVLDLAGDFTGSEFGGAYRIPAVLGDNVLYGFESSGMGGIAVHLGPLLLPANSGSAAITCKLGVACHMSGSGAFGDLDSRIIVSGESVNVCGDIL